MLTEAASEILKTNDLQKLSPYVIMKGTLCFSLALSGKRQLDYYLDIFFIVETSFSLVCFLLPTIKCSLVLQSEVKNNSISTPWV